MTSSISEKKLNKKIDHWEHQLLDLGKRNKMIHYRETKRASLKLIEPSFDELYRRIAIDEKTLSFQRSVDRETDIRVFSVLSLLEALSSPLPVTVGDIKTEGTVLERQKTLKNLRAKARLSMEEQGTNILYLSFGFLEWKEGKSASAQWLKSPLILVPAVLSLDTLQSPYTLSRHEDDIVLNPTLCHYLKTEYGIELPPFDADKDTPDLYLKKLESIADQNGWRIIREVNLGLLSFLKITMYNDLLLNENRIRENPVIRAMAGDTEEANTIPDFLLKADPDAVRTQDCYQVMSADSSQQDAILYSKNNVSFVMQGPPGTGKSQTITNIIAEALADGKKVLFVSEKMSALQVVYRRLQESHLADFCLPLHSYKANKLEILEQIGANLKLKQTRVKDTALHNLEELLTIRQELNQYAEELHRLNAELKISCYDAYAELEEVHDAPTLDFDVQNILDVSQLELQGYLNCLKEYSLALERMDYQLRSHAWEGLTSRINGYRETENMKKTLELLDKVLPLLMDTTESLTECPGISDIIGFYDVAPFSELLEKIGNLSDIPADWNETENLSERIAQAKKAKSLYEKMSELEQKIGNVCDNDIYDADYNGWQNGMFSIASTLVPLPILRKRSAYYFICNHENLLELFIKLQYALKQANDAFSEINEILDIRLKPHPHHLHLLSELLSLIENNAILPYDWFEGGIASIRYLLSEGKEHAYQLTEIKNDLLSAWLPDALLLDYAPILVRYKTEYTGFTKIFKSQYGKDKKQIQALSREVLKKLPDETAVAFLNALQKYHEHLEWFEEKEEDFRQTLGIYYEELHTDWNAALSALDTIEKMRALPPFCLSELLKTSLSEDHEEMISKLKSLLNTAKIAFEQAKYAVAESDIVIDFEDSAFNGKEILEAVDQYTDKLNELKEQNVQLKPYLLHEDTSFDDISSVIDILNTYTALCEDIIERTPIWQTSFDFLFNHRETDWENLIDLLTQTQEILKHDLYPAVTPLVLASQECKKEILRQSKVLNNGFTEAKNAFDELVSHFTEETFNKPLSIIGNKIHTCLIHIDKLGTRVDYLEAKDRCFAADLSDFIENLECSEYYKEAEKVFLKGFYRMWLSAVCEKSASIRRFRRNAQDERIEKFIELDDLQLTIAQMRIREKLIQALPSADQLLKATDEVAILNRELNKKRKIMPLRRLFSLIPNLLLTLKPCLMMSPLSVSYFLETEAYHFDLVIFDEASQIFPEDAIGAIFRGSQVIIAGDSKQLPPTNFFASNTEGFESEDEYGEISDSILEESASVLPNRTLRWHYRSKDESLIAFSNREIYQNQLITFPNHLTHATDMGVEYVYVADGYYEGGGKNCNIREAETCVELVLKHIRKYPERSLGIIAFSEKQQAAIENAIIDFRERNPQYEWFFSESKDEPFFVKNLENVQGDERDTIIFSICYAKDKNGRMYMRFGPLGQNGGERRLNVAITRAKCNIKLVGSILPSDIDLDKTNSEGVRMLRSYIEFAQKGEMVLRPVEKQNGMEAEDEFCKHIAAFLEQNGHHVQMHIGCSDYKIDIAVEHPENSDILIAGIECDGLSYIHAKTARDRDHLRKSVLEKMGWKLYRVWSTEWMRNSAAEGDALLRFLQECLQNYEEVISSEPIELSADVVLLEDIASETEQKESAEEKKSPYGLSYYKEIPTDALQCNITKAQTSAIADNIMRIVSLEQPIHMDLLYKRIAPVFANVKVTETVKKTIQAIITEDLQDKICCDESRFLYLIPKQPISARIPEACAVPRPMEYIHTEEVADALLAIITQSFGIMKEDLISECIRAFGFERKGPKIKQKTEAALQYLSDAERIRFIDGKVLLSASCK
ncbi:MAG: DUF4011 domain-containing protein [Clostridia bacterium]|nr:DUF4011 domain-containing protein [Clostridia bacterium]